MKLNYYCPINTTSYGLVSLNILKGLIKNGYEISYFPIGGIQISNQEEYDIVQDLMNKQLDYDELAPCLKIWHQFDLANRIGRGQYFGFPIFELNQFNKTELAHLRAPHTLIVCSKWAQEIIREQTGRDSYVVPLGVDTSIFKPTPYERSENCIFFNCGKIELRKGHDILADAFSKAFEPKDNVQLWMAWSNPFLTEEETKEWENSYLSTKMGEHIKFVPRLKTQADLANVMGRTTCGVFPSKAEGWNLELLEMMAVGRQVICTDYSAHTEFASSDNAFLIPITKMETAFDGKFFHGQGEWGEIDDHAIDTLVAHMRVIYDKWKHGTDLFNNEGVETANQFTWDNSVNKLMEIL
jgi:glycosyltransferase involved in cell wall biosynthesis